MRYGPWCLFGKVDKVGIPLLLIYSLCTLLVLGRFIAVGMGDC